MLNDSLINIKLLFKVLDSRVVSNSSQPFCFLDVLEALDLSCIWRDHADGRKRVVCHFRRIVIVVWGRIRPVVVKPLLMRCFLLLEYPL